MLYLVCTVPFYVCPFLFFFDSQYIYICKEIILSGDIGCTVPRSLLRVSVKEEEKFPCGGETRSLSGLRFIVRSPLIRLFDFGCNLRILELSNVNVRDFRKTFLPMWTSTFQS